MMSRVFIIREWCRRELAALRRLPEPTPEQEQDGRLYENILALIDRRGTVGTRTSVDDPATINIKQ